MERSEAYIRELTTLIPHLEDLQVEPYPDPDEAHEARFAGNVKSMDREQLENTLFNLSSEIAALNDRRKNKVKSLQELATWLVDDNQKPAEAAQKVSGSQMDWECGNASCGFVNYGGREKCMKCESPKSKGKAAAVPALIMEQKKIHDAKFASRPPRVSTPPAAEVTDYSPTTYRPPTPRATETEAKSTCTPAAGASSEPAAKPISSLSDLQKRLDAGLRKR